jgi:CDP-diacylglycerol--glycerol-3-phosphate 3-phosphatidyltransferase
VRDVYFAWLMLALFVGGFGGYALRAARQGRLRNARTEADGGSVFVGKPAMETAYWLLGPVLDAVAALGATPNAVTLFSLLPGAGAGVALAYGWFGLAAVLATISQFADIIDGLLARKLGIASDAGEALDAAVDRYVELFFLGGLAVHYRADPLLLLVLAAIGGSFMVSYATAKAEAMGVKAPRGVMRHGERVAYLLVTSALTPLVLRELPIVLALTLVAIAANVSVVQRFAAIIAALRARDGQKAPAAAARAVEDLPTEPDVPIRSF